MANSYIVGEKNVAYRKSKPFYVCMVKPSGHRTVRVDVCVVEGSSLSEHKIAINMQLSTKLRLQKFTSGWDPHSSRLADSQLLDFGSINSLRGGIQIKL